MLPLARGSERTCSVFCRFESPPDDDFPLSLSISISSLVRPLESGRLAEVAVLGAGGDVFGRGRGIVLDKGGGRARPSNKASIIPSSSSWFCESG
jgi:hypothetical protein